ncbi:MAG: nucleotidyltransferase domain-containing protein [Nanoarchaeota archaeon]
MVKNKKNKRKVNKKAVRLVKKQNKKKIRKTTKKSHKAKVVIKKKAKNHNTKVKTLRKNIKVDDKKIDSLLQQVINEIKPSNDYYQAIKIRTDEVISKISKAIKSKDIDASIFVGGSLAKGTLLKKDVNDVDLFIRFEDEKIEKFAEIMKETKEDYRMIHGSRDYAQIRKDNIIFEIIPVMKINNPKEANNVTDLTYFHVDYVLEKISKNPELINQIVLTKTFAHASGAYGAESYIKGFSGYAIELLMIHYGSLKNFAVAVANSNEKQKIIIDTQKHYKGKRVIHEVNGSKLKSPIVLIDPTFKERNALAALSEETYKKFKEYCIEFLKNPSEESFKEKIIDRKKLFDQAMNNGRDFAIIEITTNKQEGDVAGTKLLKFSKMFASEMKRYYENPEITFYYDEKQRGIMFFTGKKIKEAIIKGPPINMPEAVKAFMKKYQATINDGKNLCAAVSLNLDFSEALKRFIVMHTKTMKEMGITSIKEIN